MCPEKISIQNNFYVFFYKYSLGLMFPRDFFMLKVYYLDFPWVRYTLYMVVLCFLWYIWKFLYQFPTQNMSLYLRSYHIYIQCIHICGISLLQMLLQ